MFEFALNAEQLEKLHEWKKGIKPAPLSAIGGSLTYVFTPTALGVSVKVLNWDGDQVDLTDYDNW